MKSIGLLFILLFILFSNAFCEGDHADDREQLRGLLNKITLALNNQNMDELAGILGKDFRFTTIDQKVIKSTEELKQYYENLFKDKNAVIKGYKTSPVVDKEAVFINDVVSYCVGSSIDEYQLSNGDEMKLAIRWSVLMEKENGDWKVKLLHLGANFYDNPVLTKITESMKTLLYIAVAIAFITGVFSQIFFYRFFKKK